MPQTGDAYLPFSPRSSTSSLGLGTTSLVDESGATTPETPVRSSPLPADPAKDDLVQSGAPPPWFTWAWIASAAIFVLGMVVAVVAHLRRRNPPAGVPQATVPIAPGPPDLNSWARLSAEESEAFERTAREFGWG